MNDKQLLSFICVAECGSFSKAETKMYLSKQALMKHIDSLEQEIGVSLLKRNYQGVLLTPAGREFLDGAKQILSLQISVVENCKATAPNGVLRIPVSQDTIYNPLAISIPHFIKKYPEYSVQHSCVEESKWINAILAKELSVCYSANTSNISKLGLAYSPIIDDPIYCIMDLTHPLSNKDKITLDDLRDQQLFTGKRFWYDHIIDVLDRHKRVQELPMTYSAIYHACAGGGVFLASYWYVPLFEPFVAKPLDIEGTFSVGLVHLPNPPPAVQRFIEINQNVYDSAKNHNTNQE